MVVAREERELWMCMSVAGAREARRSDDWKSLRLEALLCFQKMCYATGFIELRISDRGFNFFGTLVPR